MGATGTLGRTLATLLTSPQQKLILIDQNTKKLEKLYDALTLKGAECCAIPFNVADISLYAQLAAALYQKYNAIQALYLCFGSPPTVKAAIDHTPQEWQTQLNTNLLSYPLLCKVFLPLLENAPQGTLYTFPAPLRAKSGYLATETVSSQGQKSFINTLREEYAHKKNLAFKTVCLPNYPSPYTQKIYPNHEAQFQPLTASMLKNALDKANVPAL